MQNRISGYGFLLLAVTQSPLAHADTPTLADSLGFRATSMISDRESLSDSGSSTSVAATGACCVDAAHCIDSITPAACVDANGVWQGAATTCASVQAAGYCVDPPLCPPNSILEGDTPACGGISGFNYGCSLVSPSFEFLPGPGCATICGTVNTAASQKWFNASDEDWFLIAPQSPTIYTACITAQFSPLVEFWQLHSGIDICLGASAIKSASGRPGEQVCVSMSFDVDDPIAVRIAALDQSGEIQQDGIGCVSYVLDIDCEKVSTGACCLPDGCQGSFDETDCVNAGGRFLGVATDCINDDCGGACCLDAETCRDFLLPSECIDANGVWQGDDTMCAAVQALGYCVDPPICPPEALHEFGFATCEDFNIGCEPHGGQNWQFLPGDCGSVVCGRSFADAREPGFSTDRDAYYFEASSTAEYSACVSANFSVAIGIWPLNPGLDPCLGIVPASLAIADPGEMACATTCLAAGQGALVRVNPVDQSGAPLPDGLWPCSSYIFDVTCDTCATGACCLPDNSCQLDLAEVECHQAGGEYQGDGSGCAGASCGGACCLPDGSCFDDVSRQSCLGLGGAYNGQDSRCAAVGNCPLCSFEDPNDLDLLMGQEEQCIIPGFDRVNRGCVIASSSLFSTIQCNETICGTTSYDGAVRDRDFYHFTIAQEFEILVALNNQMAAGNPLQFRLRWRDPNDAASQFCSENFYDIVGPARGDALPPGTTFFGLVLAPARYEIGVQYDIENTMSLPISCPDGGRYRLSIECNEPCTFACIDTENEPDCGEVNEMNAGCSVMPAGGFSPLSLFSEVCGSTRLVTEFDGMGNPVSAVRDVDWWLINIPSTGEYTIRVRPEFEAQVEVRPVGNPIDCSVPPIAQYRAFQCEDSQFFMEEWPAGQYAILITPDEEAYSLFNEDVQANELCGSAYSLEVCIKCDGLGICGDANCDGVVTVSDIGFFVTAVAQGEAAWQAQFPGGSAPCTFASNDTNGDAFVTVSDISNFVNAVINGGCQ